MTIPGTLGTDFHCLFVICYSWFISNWNSNIGSRCFMTCCVIESGQGFFYIFFTPWNPRHRGFDSVYKLMRTHGTSFPWYVQKDILYVLFFWHAHNVCMVKVFIIDVKDDYRREKYLGELLLRNLSSLYSIFFLQNYIVLASWENQ